LYIYNNGLLSIFPVKPKFIHVVRDDLISQAVSLYIASKNGQWTSEKLTLETFSNIKYEKDLLFDIIKNISFQNSSFDFYSKY
jgi:LPS sulfotransferase NodH